MEHYIKMWFNTQSIIKSVLLLTLVILFFIFFGYPALKIYQDKKVLVVSHKEDTNGIEAPAITICPTNPEIGWREVNFMLDDTDIIQPQCSDLEDEMSTCVELKTFNLSDIVRGVGIGFSSRQPLTDLSLWSEDIELTSLGRCHTFNYLSKIGPSDKTDQLYFFLDMKLNYVIHEKNNFVTTLNPVSIPHIRTDILTNSTFSHYFRLGLTQHQELDVSNDPCEEITDYNFRACVKETISKKVRHRITVFNVLPCGHIHYLCIPLL